MIETLIGSPIQVMSLKVFDTMGDLVKDFFNALFGQLCQWMLDGVVKIYTYTTKLSFVKMLDTGAILPGLSYIKPLMTAIAWGIITVLFFASIMEMVAGPVTGNEQTNPFNSIIRLVIASLAIVAATGLINTLCNIGDNVLTYMYGPMIKSMGVKSLASGTDVKIKWDQAAFGSALFSFIFCAAMTYNLIMAAINQVERFVMFGIYVLASPIAMAFSANKGTADISKNYFMTLFSEMLAIMFNTILFALFFVKVQNLGKSPQSTFMLDWMVCTALCAMASHSEDIVNALGLHTMPTPDSAKHLLGGLTGFGATVSGAVGLARGMYGAGQKLTGAYEKWSGEATRKDAEQKRLAGNDLERNTSAGQAGSRPISKQEGVKNDARNMGKTSFDKNKGFTAPELSNDDIRGLAKSHGMISDKQSKGENVAGQNMAFEGANAGKAERASAVDKLNNAYQKSTKPGETNMTSKDLSTALGLEKSMPGVDFNNDSKVVKNSDGTLTATGLVTKKDAHGNAYQEAQKFTFGDNDTLTSAGMHSMNVAGNPHGADGFGVTTDYAHNDKVNELASSSEAAFIGNKHDASGNPISSGQQFSDAFAVSSTMEGYTPQHAAKLVNKDENGTVTGTDFVSSGLMTNSNGKSSQAMYYTTQDKDLIANGGYANGMMLDNSNMISNGNGWYSIPCKAADKTQISNLADKSGHNYIPQETTMAALSSESLKEYNSKGQITNGRMPTDAEMSSAIREAEHKSAEGDKISASGGSYGGGTQIGGSRTTVDEGFTSLPQIDTSDTASTAQASNIIVQSDAPTEQFESQTTGQTIKTNFEQTSTLPNNTGLTGDTYSPQPKYGHTFHDGNDGSSDTDHIDIFDHSDEPTQNNEVAFDDDSATNKDGHFKKKNDHKK